MLGRHIKYFIALFGLALAIIFCLVIYPRIYVTHHAVLDPDGWDALGRGIWKTGTLSYFPEIQPTINRGPVYPLFLAAIFEVTDGRWWPYSIQLAQCILFGFICLTVFWIAEALWNRKVAIFSSLACAVYPFLIWYTSRIWIEILGAFLFTILVASALYLNQKPTVLRSLLVGLVIGISSLCKATFLPYIVVLPLLLIYLSNNRINWKHASYIFVVSLLIVLPWTLRNYSITGKFVPVQVLGGFNLAIGDGIVENYFKAPFSHGVLSHLSFDEKIKPLEASFPADTLGWQEEWFTDRELVRRSLSRYVHDPLFLLKKVTLNSFLFWTLGEDKKKTAVISLFQIPLLALFIVAVIKSFKTRGFRSLYSLPILLVLPYYLVHLPIFSVANFSVVLVPTIIIYAGSVVADYGWKQKHAF
jgi:4-amino-4-deoxy-L-arabinose transferase-like glycosyltransferase